MSILEFHTQAEIRLEFFFLFVILVSRKENKEIQYMNLDLRILLDNTMTLKSKSKNVSESKQFAFDLNVEAVDDDNCDSPLERSNFCSVCLEPLHINVKQKRKRKNNIYKMINQLTLAQVFPVQQKN